jgi:sulfur-oxidizing protein SoxA
MRLVVFAVAAMVNSHAVAQDVPVSGYVFMEPSTRALQDDDFLNPGFFLVDQGQAIWTRPAGDGGATCFDCHGAVEASMAGVAARYPQFDSEKGVLFNLETRIQYEIRERMGAKPPDYSAPEIIALTALISLQSRGMEMQPELSPELEPYLRKGQEIYETRRGQLNLSCPQCHVDHAGEKLRGDVISQGHINAFPIYRLLWGEPGSRHRMFEWCMQAVRAEPFERGSEEYIALELFLAQRGAGLLIEAPGVRR